MTVAVLLLVFWVAPILVAESIGKSKHRNGFVYGLILGWIGVVIVALLPPLRDWKRDATCPWCKEDIKREALVCPHCQRDVVPAAAVLNERGATR